MKYKDYKNEYFNQCFLCLNKTQNLIEEVFPVQFDYDENDGTSISPHISYYPMCVCKKCYEQIQKGRKIYGYGALSCNNYNFDTISLTKKAFHVTKEEKDG